MHRHFLPLFIIGFFLLTTAHPAQAAEPSAVKRVKVVTTFSVLGDMVAQIGGQDVAVQSLVGPDEDAHDYQPSPNDVQKLAEADIIAINGLHYDMWVGRLIKASGTKAKLLVASAGITPLNMDNKPNARDHGHADAQGHETIDPHAWQDLRNGKIYARNIAAALIQAYPEKKDVFKERVHSYERKIEELDTFAKATFSPLPVERRKAITSHDAFGYFARAYGLTLLSATGINPESEPSAADIATLIEQIRKEKISLVFVENMTDPRLIEQIAKDTGAKLGGKLYADALSKEDGPAPTYLDMMTKNIKAFAGLRE